MALAEHSIEVHNAVQSLRYGSLGSVARLQSVRPYLNVSVLAARGQERLRAVGLQSLPWGLHGCSGQFGDCWKRGKRRRCLYGSTHDVRGERQGMCVAWACQLYASRACAMKHVVHILGQSEIHL